MTDKSKNILELGVGTGPNFKYYATINDLTVIGVDPNKQMEKYARSAAVAARLPETSFSFIRGVMVSRRSKQNISFIILTNFLLGKSISFIVYKLHAFIIREFSNPYS